LENEIEVKQQFTDRNIANLIKS